MKSDGNLVMIRYQIILLLVLFLLTLSPGHACPQADLSGNCAVEIEDLVIFADQWLDPAGCVNHSTDCADFIGNDGITLVDLAVMAADWGVNEAIPVVINEIHSNPDLSYELVEFVELYNAGDESIDISGWYFSDGISYTFGPNSSIAAGEYIVVTEDASLRTISPTTSVHDKFGTSTDLIYGPFTGSLSNEGETIELRTADGIKVDQMDYQLGFPWPTVGDEIPEGNYGSGHSIQLVNPDLDNDLGGSWRSAYPTPGAANSTVYAENSPPQIRQVEHMPKSPTSSDVVTITAKVTDPDGVASVTLLYQIVTPGNYIALHDFAYDNWISLAMHDDGLGNDQYANDSIYTVQLPAATRNHRYLIRYRIVAEDSDSLSITVPYTDDPQPNFACFVYDGVPAWSGAIRPGTTTVVQYDQDVMNSLPVYHLISKQSDVEDCTWYSQYAGSDYLWYGTMIYDGRVYDHIRYRARGGVWRYAMGKNMWKFDFNRGHYFQARDNYGQKYKTQWDKLNFSACIQQGNFGHRGEQGMFEAVGFKLFNLMGVQAPNTHWLEFRIIDQADENGGTQYDGDLWGLYLAIEQMDGRYLKEHDLDDGNLYKIEGYAGELNNQGPLQPTNGTDYSAFRSAWYYASTKPTELWWRQNVDLDRYYSYRCVVEGIHHGDIGYGKNYFFYNNPQTGIWTMYPWDLDLTWANNMYGNGEDPFKSTSHGAIFNLSPVELEYQNRLREFHDLLYNTDQLYSLIDEFAAIIDSPDGNNSIVDVDRAMWDYNPVMIDSSIVNLYKAGQGRFYQAASTGDFPGMVQLMKDYVTGYRAFDTYSEDPAIPATPVITYLGEPDYPENDLRFQTSSFSDPQGAGTFAAMKWRIAEITPDSISQGVPGKYEITPDWESEDLTTFADEIQIPADGVKPGKTYRVRCRMKDNTGRWSHWSDPVQFVAGEAMDADILSNLRLTELMYNNDDAEFIELQNISSTVTLDLSNVSITSGVQFNFAGSNVTSLAPGAFVLIVKEQEDFEEQYGSSLDSKIAGEFTSGSLSNGGETVKIEDYWNGTIIEFEYNDSRGWPLAADGAGHSLVPQDWAIDDQPLGTLDFGGNWRQSATIGGSPGAVDPTLETGVVINEFMAHTDYSNPSYPDYDSNDWIELYNVGSSSVSLNGDWYLSDDADNLKKWALPGNTLNAGSHISYDEITGFHSPITSGFGLDKAGEQIFLSYLPGSSADRVVDCIAFKGQENYISLSRYPDGDDYWFSTSPVTRDAANDNPINHVVISEIMYHPAEGNEEYIELYNPTGSSVNLWTVTGPWALDGGVDYEFPPSTSLAGGDRILVVDFDPATETARLDAFEAAYGTPNLTPGVDIVGPWTGGLSNNGERVALEKPQDSDDPLDPSAISWIIVDECIYNDYYPWPTEPDGTGSALRRLSSTASACGNDAANWTAQAPTPGW